MSFYETFCCGMTLEPLRMQSASGYARDGVTTISDKIHPMY